jgi:hypothetical protein
MKNREINLPLKRMKVQLLRPLVVLRKQYAFAGNAIEEVRLYNNNSAGFLNEARWKFQKFSALLIRLGWVGLG